MDLRELRRALKALAKEMKEAERKQARAAQEARQAALDAMPFAIYVDLREVARAATEEAAKAAVAQMKATRVPWKRYWYAARAIKKASPQPPTSQE